MNDSFSIKVQEQVQLLKSTPLQEIDDNRVQKRIGWIEQHPLSGEVITPRRAFDLLFFDYMGLNPEDLQVVEETETHIEWLSFNPCPTLDACLQLGLDTRQVCHAISEKSTQAFLTKLDPRLRFVRTYTELRPYSPHCRERIEMVAEPIEKEPIHVSSGSAPRRHLPGSTEPPR